MSGGRYESVWDALSDTAAEAENMKLRAELMTALRNHMTRAGWTQTQAADVLGVTQPRISDLTRGKIDRFGLDTLVNMAATAGLHVHMRVQEAA